MKRTLAIFAMVLISEIAGSSGALADENVFQEIGEDFSNLGKEIGKTGKEVGKQLGKTGHVAFGKSAACNGGGEVR